MSVEKQEWDTNPHGSDPKDQGKRTYPSVTTRDLSKEKGITQGTPNSLRKGNTSPAQPAKDAPGKW